MKKALPQWEKEFDALWEIDEQGTGQMWLKNTDDDSYYLIKAFIKKTRDQAVTEALKRVEEEIIGRDEDWNLSMSQWMQDKLEYRNDFRSEQHAALAKMKEGI